MAKDNNLNSISYNSRIDTLQTKEPISNRLDNTLIDIKGIEKRYDENNNIVTKYNPNNFGWKYSTDYKKSKTVETLEQMQTKLTIIDKNEVEYKRIDIATDISASFDENSKFLDLIHRCIRAKEKGGVAWRNISESDEKTSNYLYHNRFKLEIEFYDKEKESNGTSNYPTRMEIRFLRIFSKSFDLHINNSIDLWKAMPNNLDQVEAQVIDVLKAKWTEEKTLNKGLTFTEFVYKWESKMFTQRILKELYKFSGLNGSYKSWLQRYKNGHQIEFYTQNQLKTFSKNVIKSLKDYLKS